MNTSDVLFIVLAALVVYTYVGYGVLLGCMVKLKEFIFPPKPKMLPEVLPEVTLLIAAYNEEAVVEEKMENCRALDYPKERLHIYWVTDGTTDKTNDLLTKYPEVTVLFDPARRGKSAALNRAMPYVKTSLTVFTDANTFINPQAIKEIVREFTDESVGCVAGEKRVRMKEVQNAASGEGIYWKYESTLKDWDYRLHTAVGAAGELFAVRTSLFITLPDDTLLDDFVMSMTIASKGFKIAYCKNAYALEDASFNVKEESKRKVRIAAGGLQSIRRLAHLLNPIPRPMLTFQYVSHRVLRWSVTPIALLVLFPLNVWLCKDGNPIYCTTLALQVLFYLAAYRGKQLAEKQIKNKYLFVPYYFMMMNWNVLKAFFYLKKNKGKGTWQKAKRA